MTEKYLFIITPIEIKSSSKIRTNSRKSVLIKLGNKTAKCPALNSPVQLEIDVLYSKTLQKYCPLKGIIKIYDVSEDGTEIISCVGGFQTDELLNHSKHQIILEKEIGTSKLKMEITIVNKGQGGKTEGLGKVEEGREQGQGQGLGKVEERRGQGQGLGKIEEGRPASSAREGQPKEETRRREDDSLRKQLDISQRNSLRSSSILQGINSNRRGPSPSLKRELSSQRLTHLASSGANLNYESVEASRTVYELEHNKKELIILKKLAGEKDKKIVSLERQLSGAELTIKNLKETNKHLGEENQYLR